MKVTQEDWKRILSVMQFYKRTEGYVDEVEGKLQFFDSDPCLNGVHACYVTIDDIREYIKAMKENQITKLEWEQILDVMLFYGLTEVCIVSVEGRNQLYSRDKVSKDADYISVTFDEVLNHLK